MSADRSIIGVIPVEFVNIGNSIVRAAVVPDDPTGTFGTDTFGINLTSASGPASGEITHLGFKASHTETNAVVFDALASGVLPDIHGDWEETYGMTETDAQAGVDAMTVDVSETDTPDDLLAATLDDLGLQLYVPD